LTTFTLHRKISILTTTQSINTVGYEPTAKGGFATQYEQVAVIGAISLLGEQVKAQPPKLACAQPRTEGREKNGRKIE
jgi:hypothetical protein